MAPPFEILDVRNTGPTDNSGLDTWVVHLRERGGEPQRFKFVFKRYVTPTDDEVRQMIREAADGFDNGRSAIEQFRESEEPYGQDPNRRVVFLPRA